MTFYAFQRSHSDHSLLTKKNENNIVVMVVYVDDIDLIENDEHEISSIKAYMQRHFRTKVFSVKYFFWIEVSPNKDGIVLSWYKCALDSLQKTRVLGTKPAHIPMNSKIHLYDEVSDSFESQSYRSLIGKIL